jgi:hypothetical protein
MIMRARTRTCATKLVVTTRERGTTLAEMPVALWMIIIMCFAMLLLATETLRFGFFWNACREAAQQAAKCTTFQADTAIGPSAVTTANTWATKAAGAFSGLTLNTVNVYIVSTNVSSGVMSKTASGIKLANAADTSNNIYDIQVELIGQIEPLIRFSNYFGSIPGLSAPFPVVVRSQYTSEVPQGLSQ